MRLNMSVTTVSLRSPDNLIRPHFRLFSGKLYIMKNILVESDAKSIQGDSMYGAPSWKVTNRLEIKYSPFYPPLF